MALSIKPVMYLVLLSGVFILSNDWWEDKYPLIPSTILPININDFWSAKSEHFLQILQYETLSESSIKNKKSAGHLN